LSSVLDFSSVLGTLPAFPTRRSSDLDLLLRRQTLYPLSYAGRPRQSSNSWALLRPSRCSRPAGVRQTSSRQGQLGPVEHCRDERSEEHTSELQSRFDLVCRLLLEKKN